MVPKLEITKVQSGLYEAHIDISASTMHSTIAEALKFVGEDVPEDFAHFVEIWYGTVTIGMHSLAKLRVESYAVADQLVELAAAVYQSEEELAQR